MSDTYDPYQRPNPSDESATKPGAETPPASSGSQKDEATSREALDEAREAAAEAAAKAAAAAKEVGRDLKEGASELIDDLKDSVRSAGTKAREVTSDTIREAKEELHEAKEEFRGPSEARADSTTGLDANLAAALSYVFPPVTGPLMFFWEKGSAFVRFHALQSILLCFAYFITWLLVGVVMGIPFLGGLVAAAASVGFAVAWLLVMWKALQYREFHLPIIGDLARNHIDKRAPSA